VRRAAPVVSAADFVLAANGTLVYVPADSAAASEGSQLVWVDRGGRVAAPAVERSVGEVPFDARLSPDGQRLVVSTGFPIFGATNNLWVHDLGGRPPIVLTDGGNDNRFPVWSADGKTIAFISNWSSGVYAVRTLPADGSAREPQTIQSLTNVGPAAWTKAGELVLYSMSGNGDIVVARLDDPDGPRPVVATAAAETYPRLSPDEHWLAYASDRTGRAEIWVKQYPDGVPMRVSSDGGSEPVWSRDGHELFYRRGAAMMAMAVSTSAGTFSFEPGKELFTTSPYIQNPDVRVHTYDVAADGKFLMSTRGRTDARRSASIVVIENWSEEVKRRVPVR